MSDQDLIDEAQQQSAADNRGTATRGNRNRGNRRRGFGKHVSPGQAKRIRQWQMEFSRGIQGIGQSRRKTSSQLPKQTSGKKEAKSLKPNPISDVQLQSEMESPLNMYVGAGTEAFILQRGSVVVDKHDRKRLIVGVFRTGYIVYIDKTGAWSQATKGFIDDIW